MLTLLLLKRLPQKLYLGLTAAAVFVEKGIRWRPTMLFAAFLTSDCRFDDRKIYELRSGTAYVRINWLYGHRTHNHDARHGHSLQISRVKFYRSAPAKCSGSTVSALTAIGHHPMLFRGCRDYRPAFSLLDHWVWSGRVGPHGRHLGPVDHPILV